MIKVGVSVLTVFTLALFDEVFIFDVLVACFAVEPGSEKKQAIFQYLFFNISDSENLCIGGKMSWQMIVCLSRGSNKMISRILT